MTLKPLDQALDDLRAVPDPYARLSEAHDLDSALVMARSVVAQIKRDTINALRGSTTGYGTIAQRLSLTKARVQQIANAPRNPGLAAAYAFRDEHGGWHGEPALLPGAVPGVAIVHPVQSGRQIQPARWPGPHSAAR